MVEAQRSQEPPPPPSGRLGRSLRIIDSVELAAGVAFLVAILVLVMIQIIVRFTAFAGWPWTGELARFGLMWMTFILAGYLLGHRQHITLDVLDAVLPERSRRVIDIVSALIVAAICIAFVYEGIGLIETQSAIRSTAARIPMSVVYAIPTIGFALTALRALSIPFVARRHA